MHFIPLYLTISFTSFYSFTGIYILFLYRYLYFIHSFSVFYFIYSFHVHCTGAGGTIPRGQSLCESMSLCRCLVFILCMPVCNYTLRLTLCAVYGYYFYLGNLFLFSTLLSTLVLSFSII